MSEQLPCCLVLLLTRFTLPYLLPDTRWALTPPFHPYLVLGGIFSAALSLALRLPGVTRRHVLWSPDFPPVTGYAVTGDRLAHQNIIIIKDQQTHPYQRIQLSQPLQFQNHQLDEGLAQHLPHLPNRGLDYNRDRI